MKAAAVFLGISQSVVSAIADSFNGSIRSSNSQLSSDFHPNLPWQTFIELLVETFIKHLFPHSPLLSLTGYCFNQRTEEEKQ